MKAIFKTLVLGLLLSSNLIAQDKLTFEDALAKTLENNFDIQLSKINVKIAENNADKAANGYLPTVAATGGYTWTFYEGNNKLITEDRPFDANNSFSYNAGIMASYTIFDGFGRKYQYQIAQGNEQISNIQMKLIMESAILELSQTFHEVARLEQQTESLESTLSISKDRLQRAQYGFEFGQNSQLDILNAQVDLNNDSINLINSKQEEENAKRNLNLIMGAPIEGDLLISENVSLGPLFNSEEVIKNSLIQNNTLKNATLENLNAQLSLESIKSNWYPNLGVSGGYQYQGNNNPNGAFVIGSNNYGPTAGLTLSWNIFNGQTKTQVNNAKLQMESGEISLKQAEEQIKMNALNAHGAYRNALYVFDTSQLTLDTAQDNFERSQESFDQGQITSIEFRQAQVNLLTAELQLSQAKFSAKNAEIQMLAIMGSLVK